MLNFPGYDVGESRRLFNGEIQSSAAGQGPMHRSPGYLHGFGEPCYDSPVNGACSPVGYGQPLAGYAASAPSYGSYRLPFNMTHAAAVYDEQRKFDCCNKPDLNRSVSHGNYTRQRYIFTRSCYLTP